MAKRRSEIVAASLLTGWTDADTAMQVVGSSLGLFGAGPLDPTVVLSAETRLRNALFDVLLSLVEGGALEMRIAGDNRYAFRWRDDVAIAGLAPDDSPAIDLAVPSPYLAELERAHAERDDALGRAEFAEGLAAERERLLRLAEAARTSNERAIADRARKPAGRKPAGTKAAAKKPEPEKAPQPTRRKVAAKSADVVAPAAAPTHELLLLTEPGTQSRPEIDLLLEAYGTVDGVDAPGQFREGPLTARSGRAPRTAAHAKN